MLKATDGTGRTVNNPSKPAITRMLAALRRGGNAHLVLERAEDGLAGDWYIQVLLRNDNTYQLEFRDGVAAEHYQTRTVSQEKVATAMLGWAAGGTEWKHGFMWNTLAAQFAAEDSHRPC